MRAFGKVEQSNNVRGITNAGGIKCENSYFYPTKEDKAKLLASLGNYFALNELVHKRRH